MNINERLAKAIQTGVPVPGTPEQAAELAGYIRCRECGKVGPQGRMSSGALIPICAACKADADMAAEAACLAPVFAGRLAADIVRCPECKKLGPRDTESIYRTDGVCVKCGTEREKRDRDREYMADGREGRDSFDRYCNEGDDE